MEPRPLLKEVELYQKNTNRFKCTHDEFDGWNNFLAHDQKNIATGETSWAIASSHFLNYFHFFYFFDYFHFFGCFQFFDYFHFCDYYNFVDNYNFFEYSCIREDLNEEKNVFFRALPQ